MRPRRDIAHGERYGRLTVVGEAARRGYHRYFTMLCDCGQTTVVYISDIGRTKSCGCLQRELASLRQRSRHPKLRLRSLGRLAYIGDDEDAWREPI